MIVCAVEQKAAERRVRVWTLWVSDAAASQLCTAGDRLVTLNGSSWQVYT